MSKEIYCISCTIFLGEIHDAHLLKDIKFLCPKCDTKRIAADQIVKNKKSVDDVNFFKDIFNLK